MAWTEMQKKAIYTRGQNIIVSAGAGSGKTAVLSERILEYCLQGNDIRRVLVLTFTNAAAQEMKERIRSKLLEHHLDEAASLIDSAFITTFDAYSLALVKKYYFHLGVDKNIKILDQSLLELKKRELLDQIFMELYQAHSPEFYRLLKKYAKQNDENIKNIVLSLAQKLELIVDEHVFVREYEKEYYSPQFLDFLLKEYETLALSKASVLKEKLEQLALLAGGDPESLKLSEEVTALVSQFDCTSYDEMTTILQMMSLPRVNSKADESVKIEKTKCADLWKEVKTSYFSKYIHLEEAREELYSIQEDVLYLLKLSLRLLNELLAYKYEIMAFDYIDIAKLAIRLVKENEAVHQELQLSYQEILIDEYQDTSDLQEAFISAISNHNCYMVGDIKQSIYRFRNANPYIFKSKYERYAQNDGGLKIDLVDNFRSRREVLDDINSIFSFLMTNEQGDANYSYEHQMRYGQKKYEELLQDTSYTMEVLGYELPDGYTEEEVEAFLCGYQIKKLMSSHLKCLKKDTFKEVCYSDIAILIDKTKSFVTFKKVFEYLGIPLSIEADLDLKDSILPKLMANILILITGQMNQCFDKTYDHALASIARSFLFSYDEDTVYRMVCKKEKNELQEIVASLASKASSISMDELFYEITEYFHIYEKLPTIGDVNNSCVVLEYIHSLFETMKHTGMSVVEASSYFAKLFEQGIALKYKLAGTSSNSVHIMTIHKSKGLEFPYCFFPMLGSSFNKKDLKDTFGLSRTYGVYIPYADETSSNTIVKALAAEEIRKADLSEKIRLLYVALTRAREKFYLISNQKEYREGSTVSSFNQMLQSLHFVKEQTKLISCEEIGLSKQYRYNKLSVSKFEGAPISYQEEAYESEAIVKQNISKELKQITDHKLKTAIQLGQSFHECLEILDFKNPEIDALPVDSFIKATLTKLLKTEVFNNMAEAKTYHEHEFYFEDEGENYHGIIDLFAEYQDHIDIIDYKLASVDSEEYIRQLSIYKAYISSKSKKPVYCYLLSILNQEVRRVL